MKPLGPHASIVLEDADGDLLADQFSLT